MLNDTHTIKLVQVAVQVFSISDAELGNYIRNMALTACRQLDLIDDSALNAEERTFLMPFFATVLPEVSARLMLRDGIHIGSRRDAMMRNLSDADLRNEFEAIFTSRVFKKLQDASKVTGPDKNNVRDIDIAISQAVNGNVGLIAMDRLIPPNMSHDTLGQTIKLAAPLRGFSAPDGMWTPDMALHQLEDFGAYAGAAQIENYITGLECLEEIDVLPEMDIAV